MNHRLPTILPDAIDMLRREHAILKQLFHAFARLEHRPGGRDREAGLVGQICLGLSLHEQTEDEVFFPAVLAACGNASAIRHITSGHTRVRSLIARLDEMEPGDPGHDATVAALGACVSGHIDEEESLLFSRRAGHDTAVIGRPQVLRPRALRANRVAADPHPGVNDVSSWPATCHVVDGWQPPESVTADPDRR